MAAIGSGQRIPTANGDEAMVRVSAIVGKRERARGRERRARARGEEFVMGSLSTRGAAERGGAGRAGARRPWRSVGGTGEGDDPGKLLLRAPWLFLFLFFPVLFHFNFCFII